MALLPDLPLAAGSARAPRRVSALPSLALPPFALGIGLCLGLAGCFRGAKVEVTADYLAANQVYRSAAFAREPYLVLVEDRAAVIACRTYSSEAPRLRLAPFVPGIEQRWTSAPAALDDDERARLAAAGRPASVHDHRVRLTGLAPRTAYHVIVTARAPGAVPAGAPPGAGLGAEAKDSRFRTLPAAGAPLGPSERVSFLVLGDSGTGSPEQLAVARAIEASLDRPGGIGEGVDFVVHTGDLVYERGEAADYEPCVFAPYRALLARAPLYGALGNHDVRSSSGRPFLAALAGAPPSDESERAYWRRRLGPVDLVVLDSTRASEYEDEPGEGPRGGDLRDQASAQRRWLRAALQQLEAPWRFVVLHHPALSAGTRHGAARLTGAWETEEMRRALHEAFGRVDFVLQGHDHHYERSVPIDPLWIDPETGALAIPDEARGRGLSLEAFPAPERATLAGRTVAVLQGTGGGRLADTGALRAAYALVWGLLPWLGSPLWMSFQPIGFDWVDTAFPWVERAGVAYGLSRFDVTPESARIRTWTVEPGGQPRLVDDVTYTR